MASTSRVTLDAPGNRDKGKGRAEPEPDPEDKVLSPTFMLAREDVDDEGDEDGPRFDPRLDARYAGREEVASPTVRSRSWVEEEGEVFRKGTVLLGPEEMEGEYAGEELRREVSRGVWVQREGAKADVNFSFSSWKPWSSARRRAK